MDYKSIKKLYITICSIIFALLFVLMMIRTGWRITPKAILSTLVGWLIICSVIIGLMYMMIAKGDGSKKKDTSETPENDGDQTSLPE